MGGIAEAKSKRENQFDTAGTAADNGQVERPCVVANPFRQRVIGDQKVVNRFDRQGVLRTVNIKGRGRGAGVDRQKIKRDRRSSGQSQKIVVQINPGCGRMDQARAGKRRQGAQVDMGFGACVMPGDVAGDHHGIGGQHIPCDQGQADARLGLHAEALEHIHMAVAAANQNDVVANGNRRCHESFILTGVGCRCGSYSTINTHGAEPIPR